MSNNNGQRQLGPGRGRRWSHHERSMLKFMRAHGYSW